MKKALFVSILMVGFAISDVLAANYYIGNIEIEGLKRVEEETVLAYLGLKKGHNVTQSKLDGALKNLYATGLFSDIQMENKSGGVLLVKLEENPVIGQRAFDGNKKLDDKILEDEVQSVPNSLYSKAKVQQDVQRILEIYKRSGRYSVEVEPKLIERDDNRVDLIFEIDEGPAAKIDKINFLGNTHYSSSDLQEEIMSKESRWYRIFSSSETYDAEKMNYDKELLRRFYTEHGYADFQVISAIAELAPNKKSFILNFSLDEGPRYEISDIKINSAIKEIKTEDFLNYVTFSKGDWYNANKIENSVSRITEELGKKGFVFVDVVPKFNKDMQNNKMEIVFDILEGERTFVNRINIMGNTRTLDEVIRREFRLDEGDAFNVSKIGDSRRNIENLNYFSKVEINPVPLDNSKADINVEVEEKSTGYFNVGIGYSTVNGALVQAGVTENNFMGKGQRLSVDASVSERSKDYSMSFTEPYFLGRRLSAGADVFYNDESYQDESSYDSASVGGRIRLGWNYTDNLYQTVRYTLSRDEIKDVKDFASIYIKREEGKSTDSVIGQTLVYDKRDNALRTKDGYYLSFGNDISGLGGDEKYFKFDVKAYKFVTFNDYWTLKTHINGGYVTSYGDEDVRLSKRYYLGGNTLRGFEYSGVGARDIYTDDALGGNWVIYGGAELMFPLGLDELGIRGRTFVDAGVIGKPDDIDSKYVEYSSKPRVSVGFGFEWYSPMGKIDIDFGFPIVKEDYDQKEVFRLNFGTSL
ncbi:MAG: outer membrane protein assembly factor BamA [Alphaproteobacteria bacterium]|nr:outer membrane protein assembly factor BamA [Alphaproteobacteria bacterium]